MYLSLLKASMVRALQATMNSQYPNPNLADMKVSVEYPWDQAAYPAIWVDFHATEPVRQAGIGHIDTAVFTDTGVTPPVSTYATYSEFVFEGDVTFTIATLSSLERDNAYDEMLRILMAGAENPQTSTFRESIEQGEFLAINARWDMVDTSGTTAAPGTPWGTDETIYETTVSLHVQGYYYVVPEAGTLVALSKITLEEPTPYFNDPPA